MTDATGWRTARLGELIEAKYGKSLPAGNRSGGPVSVYGSNGVVGSHNQALTSGPTIVIGRKGSSGAVNFSLGPCWPIDTTYFIDEPGPFRIEFLDYLLRSLGLRELDRSTAIPGLNRDELYDIEVPVPPAGDQDDLVELLDDCTQHGTSASGHLSAAWRSVEQFRQSLLAAACSGRLTVDFREANPSAVTAEALVATIDAKRRARLGRRYKASALPETATDLPDGWTWTRLGALVDVATGATPLRARSDYYHGSIPWVTSGAVNSGLITEPTEYLTELAIKQTNAKVFPVGTLVVAMYGEGQTRGRVAELAIDAATNQALAALLFDEASEALRPYLRIFLLENYERIRRLSFGGVQPNLSLGVIRDMELPLPPSDEQIEIVRRVDQLMATAQAIKDRIDGASQGLERSAQAVLAKAFHGDLIPSLSEAS